jgi:hypothetical protein
MYIKIFEDSFGKTVFSLYLGAAALRARSKKNRCSLICLPERSECFEESQKVVRNTFQAAYYSEKMITRPLPCYIHPSASSGASHPVSEASSQAPTL